MQFLRKTGIRLKIILTFSVLMILLVIILSRISYLFVRNIYLDQLYDHISDLSALMAEKLDPKFLNLVGNSNENLAAGYYREQLKGYLDKFELNNAFLFDSELKVLVSVKPGISSARLSLNRKEIRELRPGMLTCSMPFKGEDRHWYLWSYHRLNDQYFLGLQESVDRLARLDELSRLFYMIGLAGFLLTVLSGWILAGTIARPIDALVRFSAKIGKGDFRAATPEHMHGELSTLSNALIRMRDDLERIQHDREELLAQIAHEIRNPLGGIELLTGLIREDVAKGSKNAVYADKIIQEISLLKNQINAYLSFSRPVDAREEKVDVSRMIHDIQRDFKQRFSVKNITFDADIRIDFIPFDPQHLRQVLNNLIANSLEVVDQKGHIRVEAEQENGIYRMTVSDDGSGVSEENLQKIFEPFFTNRSNGTGLGLSISKKLCEENRAGLSVRNNPERGCTFTIVKESPA